MLRRRRLSRWFVPVIAVLAAAAFAGVAWATVFSNAAAITINDNSNATPYPSDITASGLSGGLTAATATITGLTHTFVADVDILLVGPGGKSVILMSDAGFTGAASNLTITFSDAAGSSLPCAGALGSGTFKPTDCAEVPATCATLPADSWPAPAPVGPYGSTMSALFASPTPPANGTYSLYLRDDCGGDTGQISGGWSVNLTGGGPTAVALRSFGALPSRKQVVLQWRTASEATVLGFNVYRVSGKHTVRVNRTVIAAKAAGTIADGSYRLVDRSVRTGRQYTYRLQSVSPAGARAWIGTAAVRIAD